MINTGNRINLMTILNVGDSFHIYKKLIFVIQQLMFFINIMFKQKLRCHQHDIG